MIRYFYQLGKLNNTRDLPFSSARYTFHFFRSSVPENEIGFVSYVQQILKEKE